MNIITMLSGIMGTGKSTFIKENNLEEYTISTDDIRLILGQPRHTVDSDGNVRKHMANIDDKKVFEIFYETIESRMMRGEYIVLDAMNVSSKSQNYIKKLAKKHKYRVNLVDIQGNMRIEQILEQNKNRVEYKVIPDDVIKQKYNKRYSDYKERGRINLGGINLIDKEKFKETFFWSTKDLNNYDKVFVIGDIHGCYTALKEGLGEIKDNYYYIFLGDFFDRGVENKEVFLFIKELMNKDNAVFLIGNHEEHLINFTKREKGDSYFIAKGFLKNTVPEILSGGDISIKDMSRFAKKLQVFFAFEYNGQKYICSHGGILPEQYNGQEYPEFKNGLYDITREPSKDIIFGIGGYNFDIDYHFDRKQLERPKENRVIQFHGHRNSFHVEPYAYEYCYNLEDNVEMGGYLRIAEITKNGLKINKIKNNIYNKELLHDSLYVDMSNLTNLEIKECLDNSKYIKGKKFKELTAYNFSQEAFYDSFWNAFTTTARGLILKNNGDIFSRGYNKFFNIDENVETTIDAIKEKVKYPLKASVKENGYLGIMTGDGSRLHFFSKSGSTNYSTMFQTMFYKLLKENGNIKNIEKIQELLSSNNYSVTFEVINIEKDKHIVTYNESKLVILDVIKNQYDLEFQDDIKDELSRLTGFETPESYIINNNSEFEHFLGKVKDEVNTEGYVFKDSNNYMFKLKNDDYKFIKSLRGLLHMIKNRKIEDFSTLPNWVNREPKYIEALNKIKNHYNLYQDGEPDMFEIRKILSK